MKQIDPLVQESFSLCFLELSGCSLGDEGFQLLVGDQDQRRAGLGTVFGVRVFLFSRCPLWVRCAS